MLTKQRIATLDILRGCALLGILIMNIPAFALPRLYPETLVRYEGAHTLNYYAWMLNYVFLEGKMRYTFSVLFGAGIILFTSRKTQENLNLADAYFRRLLWLLVFSLLTTYFLMASTEILYEYASCGMLLFVFRNARARWLLVIAITCFAVFSVKNGMGFVRTKAKYELVKEARVLQAQEKKLDAEHEEALKFWKNGRNPEISVLNGKYQSDIKTARSDYASIFEANAEIFNEAFSRGFYTDFWETFGSMALGMALFKIGFLSGARKKRTYLLWSFIGLGIGIPFSYYLSQVLVKGQLDLTGWYFDTRWFSVFHMMQIPRFLCMMGYVSFVILLSTTSFMRIPMFILGSLGRMAFTNYLFQNIFCSVFFFGFGFGMYGRFEYYQLYWIVLAIWMIQIVFTLIWLRFFPMGPFEWLWRRLTYGKEIVPKLSVLPVS